MPRERYFPNWQIRPGALEEINKLISAKSMHVKKASCLDLPPLVKEQVFVELSGEQARLYKQMKADFITYVNEKACVAQLAITKALRLMQIVSGFAVVEGEGNNDRSEVVIKDNPKAQALKELLSEIAPHSKCIVWLVFSQDYVTARKICSDLSLDYVEITGEVSSQNKLAAVDRFNEDPTCRVAICHPAASGVGVNMVSASYSIFYCRTFSLEYDIQAEARNYRGGSEIHEKVTRIDIIAKDTIDELVVAALAAKEDVAKKILEIAKKL
jgi:SNF2 family DNA or RNA helicase